MNISYAEGRGIDFAQAARVLARSMEIREDWDEALTREAFLNSITDRKSDRIGWELTQIFQSEGYAPDATMLVVFSYNGRASGTNVAYDTVIDAFNQIKTGNKRFFYTVVDTSVTEP